LAKTVKIASALGARLPSTARGSTPQSPALSLPPTYHNFIKFVSNAKCVLLLLKKEQNSYSKCSIFASSALLHKHCSYALNTYPYTCEVFDRENLAVLKEMKEKRAIFFNTINFWAIL